MGLVSFKEAKYLLGPYIGNQSKRVFPKMGFVNKRATLFLVLQAIRLLGCLAFLLI